KGVSRSFREAPIFIGIFTFLIATGALIAILPGLPLMRVLVVTQFINGLLLPVMLVAVLRLAGDRTLMGEHVNGAVYNVLAWLMVLVVSGLSLLLVGKTLFGGAP
ncbi:MAG TPA: divalent metal cation transporter, partial [Pyrinomonadaceae bacterium]|nr:divalent metal cation transporter [Pyrinomonadaceae bacterium]